MEGAGTVTVFVTDLVGSTALRVAVGEVAADQLRQTHDQLLADVITRRGGSVVKGMGDGILATFLGAADAVSAAVEVQQAVDAWETGTGGRLAMRVGISAGDVNWDAGDCFGTPVIEASRLCAAADGGQILVADVVRVLARGRHGNDLTPLGALELKGLPEPVATYDVTWTPLTDAHSEAQVPLPSPLRSDREFTFAGRDAELGRLKELWAAAQTGERGCALLGGEPGIGKTRLAAEIAAFAHEQDATVLYGRCEEDMGFSYQPFVEILQQFVDNSNVDTLRTRLGPHGGDLARLYPSLEHLVPELPPPLQSDPEAERHRLFEAVAGWLRTIAQDEPVVVVIDDLHGAATPALLMLRHVLRGTDGARALFVGTYRDTELGRTHPLAETLAELRRTPGVERISLVGLDERDLAVLLEQPDDAALTNVVYAETEGNPFFAREVLRHLQESGAIAKRDGRWVVDGPIAQLGIPEGVREVIGRRLANLSAAANDALSIAAVVGNDFTLGVLTQAQGGDEDDVVTALDDAVTARLLIEVGVGSYRFSHALVRSTLYDELGLTARVRLHRRVGEALEVVQPDNIPALAHHFALAAAGGRDAERAARYNLMASKAAQDALASDDATAFAHSALELLEGVDDDMLRCDVLSALGCAERMLGLGEHREHLLEAAHLARAHGDVTRLVAATLSNGGGVADVAGIDRERVELLEASLEAVGPADSAERARLLALLAYQLYTGDGYEPALPLCDDALEVARRLDDPHTLTFVLHAYCDATQVPHTLATRRALSAENVALARSTGDPVALGWALQDQAFVRSESGDPLASFDEIMETGVIGAEYGIGVFVRAPAIARTAKALTEGRLADAEVLADEVLRVFTETGHRSAFVFYAAQLLAIRRDQGRLAELLPLVAQAASDNPTLVAFQTALATIHADLDQPAEARAALQQVSVDQFAAIKRDWLWLTAMCNCAEVSAWLGDKDTAADLFNHLRPFHDRWAILINPVGAVGRFLGALAGVLERYDEADGYFAEGAAADERAGAVTCLARTRFDWARMLFARGDANDADRAEVLLDQVLVTAVLVGLPTLERQARELLENR